MPWSSRPHLFAALLAVLTMACAGAGTTVASDPVPVVVEPTVVAPTEAAPGPSPVVPDRSRPLVPPVDPGSPVLSAPPASAPVDRSTPSPAGTETASDEVAVVQQRLTELRYYDGPADGVVGRATTTALQAFQKVQGLTVDGAIGPETLAALDDPVLPEVHAGAATQINIDLDRQVMVAVVEGRVARIMPISSGNGDPYSLPGGIRAESLTPVGTFTIERRIQGTVNAHFGTLYDPMYFHQGWAIHGSNNVPAVPASHGCVRLPRADAEWLYSVADVGTPVTVVGGLNAFDPAAGETAGTTEPAGDPGPPPEPPSDNDF